MKWLRSIPYLFPHRIHFLLMGRVDKGFFMADNEWTCYRRNYFQVSGSFGFSYSAAGMPQSVDPVVGTNYQDCSNLGEDCLIEWKGQQRPILRYKLGVLARVAASEKEVTLVQHTTKRDKGPQESPGPKSITVNRHSNHIDHDGDTLSGTMGVNFFSTDVVTYERLQFKAATANNGKRRAAQQYFCVDLVLYGEVPGDHVGQVEMVKLATSSSCSLVVRGRSPGHYLDGGAPWSATTAMASYPALSPGAAFSSQEAYNDGYSGIDGVSNSSCSHSANAFGASPADRLSNSDLFGPASNPFSSASYDQLSLAPSSAYGTLGSLSDLSLNSQFGDAASLNMHHGQDSSFQNVSSDGGFMSHSQAQQQQQQHGFDSLALPSLASLPGFSSIPNKFDSDANTLFNNAVQSLMNYPAPMAASNSMMMGQSGSLLSDEAIESALQLS